MNYPTICLFILAICIFGCQEPKPSTIVESESYLPQQQIKLTIEEANRLAKLPLECIQTPLPFKSDLIISTASDLQMPQIHHPAFFGCFDWHSAVHGHWSLVYLMKTFPDLSEAQAARKMLSENLTQENIQKEIQYFSLNSNTKSFERTYGWAWLLKLQEELFTWDDAEAKVWFSNIAPLAQFISEQYQSYLPKLVYPIRVGEHSNSAFGLSFAFDYAQAVGDNNLKNAIEVAARRFYLSDHGCPISWEPSGYDFLSPCLQEMDIMRKVLSTSEFDIWSHSFLPELYSGALILNPGEIRDRTDGKLVHLDGLNFSRAWCLYSLKNSIAARKIADDHLAFSLNKISDGDYAGQHWLASFALYAFKTQTE